MKSEEKKELIEHLKQAKKNMDEDYTCRLHGQALDDALKLLSKNSNVNASEALYGFIGWLTTRAEAVTFSANHDAALAADLVYMYIQTNKLEDVRDDVFPNNLKHPME